MIKRLLFKQRFFANNYDRIRNIINSSSLSVVIEPKGTYCETDDVPAKVCLTKGYIDNIERIHIYPSYILDACEKYHTPVSLFTRDLMLVLEENVNAKLKPDHELMDKFNKRLLMSLTLDENQYMK